MGKPRIKIIDDSVDKTKEVVKKSPKKVVVESKKEEPIVETVSRVVETKKAKAGPKSGRKTKKTEVLETPKEETVEAQSSEKKTKSVQKREKHGKDYQAVYKMVDKNKVYPIDEALELIKKTSFVKFDPSVDAHINVVDKGLRGNVNLPHGSGKKKRILIITEKNAKEEIKKIEDGHLSFDILITTPNIMPELAKVAKILGPRGLMPNPKSSTITDDIDKTVQKLEGGFLEFKTELNAPLIHQPIGRLSFTNEQIKANLQALITAIDKKKIQKITLASSMGPGIKIDSSTL